jgi:FG-GAP repeat
VAGAVGIAAYACKMPSAALPLQLTQKFTSGIAADNYGFAVAINNAAIQSDSVIAVSADGDDTFFMNNGKVYLYQSNNLGVYSFLVSLTPPSPALTGNFGTSISMQNDALVVGEPKAVRPSDSLQVGAVHIYRRNGNTYILEASIYGNQVAGQFGRNVAIDGNSLAIGAPKENDLAPAVTGTGATYIYTFSGGAWTQQARLVADDRVASDELGQSVSLEGDVLLVGSGIADAQAITNSGAAYIFQRTGTTWSQTSKLISPNIRTQEHFGDSVSLRAGEAVIGAYCLNSAACMGNGGAYVFQRTGSVWNLREAFSPAESGAGFGRSLLHAGGSSVIVGGFLASGAGGARQGAVYALKQRPDGLFANGFE